MMQHQALGAFEAAVKDNKLPILVPTDAGAVFFAANVSSGEVTFLAKSRNRRARGLAAIMAACDAHDIAKEV